MQYVTHLSQTFIIYVSNAAIMVSVISGIIVILAPKQNLLLYACIIAIFFLQSAIASAADAATLEQKNTVLFLGAKLL